VRVVVVVLAVLAVFPASAGAVEIGYVKTLFGRIVCGHLEGRVAESSVLCVIRSGLKPPPAGECEFGNANDDRVFVLARGGAGLPDCVGDPGPMVARKQARVLDYGRTWRGRHWLRCTSRVKGLTCRNRAGRGFFMSKDRWFTF
jgi:hypothetical protein